MSCRGLKRKVEVKVPKAGNAESNVLDSDTENSFAKELHEKLAAKKNMDQLSAEKKQPQHKQHHGKETRLRHAKNSLGAKTSILVEQSDGNLVESNYAFQQDLKKEREQRRLREQLARMTKREREAYMKHSGGTRVSGEDLVDHTHRQMDVGMLTTMRARDVGMRQAANIDMAKASRLQTSAQPAGLWRQYSSANEGRPNAPADSGGAASSRVLGW